MENFWKSKVLHLDILGKNIRSLSLIIAPLLVVVIVLFCDFAPGKPMITKMAAVGLLMAMWWVTEIVPLAITALLPVILYPTLGIMNGKTVATLYFNHIIFLFIGGFMVALAIQKWDLHKRIALNILLRAGNSTSSILLGFMIATAFLSMWISNTATAMMMVPIALAVLGRLEDLAILSRVEADIGGVRRYSKGIFLGIAYSASVGGTATLIGTPPNLLFSRIFDLTFPDAPDITFLDWMSFAFPLSIVLLFGVWVWLNYCYCWGHKLSADRGVFKEEYKKLGKMSREEKIVSVVFFMLAMLWLGRRDIPLGLFTIPGWASFFEHSSFLNDGTASIAMGSLLFLIPSKRCKSGRIMDWEATKQLPWDIVLLFGGGFALADGMQRSELAPWIVEHLHFLQNLHPLMIVLMVCLLITVLTELISNTATTQMLLPILASLAISMRLNPLLLMLPATLCASCAFMLPVSTPPNAVVFGSGKLSVIDMVKTGCVLIVMCILGISLYTYFFGEKIFYIDFYALPDWAKISPEAKNFF